ncbi:response regulator transcription factor [Schleiferilactobacillus perolens]|uniref:DNA-binding response regulator, OmpR family (Rec-wHTH domains) n=1 Tax=Schleiferilactobacillus perolens DSM 12744 TaxID=1423792 RepID=A0A0R1MTM3_9LACO|nr:response regulator transcription factor [Schleiferilactobacillus perolens]KRL11345.1 DNA-binding response regulator, OmpR family (Rec-wHTH domains) [Schleiferilactobacillus perolens DSM 12744]
MQSTVLLVDDDPGILQLVSRYFNLQLPDYGLVTADSGSRAMTQLQNNPDLILLDVNLPDIDGFTLTSQIRTVTSAPIIFLTARVTDADKVRGLGAGGDDYVTKPFSLAELGARIQAHLRRAHWPEKRAQVAAFGDLIINYSAQQVIVNGQPLVLEKKQYQLIEFLSLNPGQVFSREQLYEKLWGFDAAGDARVITEHVRRIRNTFVQAGAVCPIDTVWGVGYRWQN